MSQEPDDPDEKLSPEPTAETAADLGGPRLDELDDPDETFPPKATAETVGDWSGPLPDDGRVTGAHRRAQGEWRSKSLQWPAGETGNRNYPTLPNYLAQNHDGRDVEMAGVNLMSPAARVYAGERVKVVKAAGGLIHKDRLYRNLLSSQPIAFSVAGELRAQPDAAAAVLQALTGRSIARLAVLASDKDTFTRAFARAKSERKANDHERRHHELYRLHGVEAEWFPPTWAHTGDHSGADVAFCLETADNPTERLLVTVEVKYTDDFGGDPVAWERYEPHLERLGITEGCLDDLVKTGCSQVLRQVMYTDSVVDQGLVSGSSASGQVDGAIAVILARRHDQKAEKVASDLAAAQSRVPVVFWSLDRFLKACEQEHELNEWARAMQERYPAEP